jgi:hypothetical protein
VPKKVGRKKKENFARVVFRAPVQERWAAPLPPPFFCNFLICFLLLFLVLFGSLGTGLAFWKNGCTTLPFFECCSYTWEGEIFHSAWNLEISFFSKFFFLKVEYTRTSYPPLEFLSNKKMNSLKIPQEFLVKWKFFVPLFKTRCI